MLPDARRSSRRRGGDHDAAVGVADDDDRDRLRVDPRSVAFRNYGSG
jgi:hypothetical protein